MMDPVTLLAAWLGSLFVYSGALKMATPAGDTLRAIQGYQLLPAPFERALATVLPPAELVVGGLMLLSQNDRLGAVGASALGIVFFVGIASALVRGIKAPCGCAGRSSDPISTVSLARAALIVIAGAAVVTTGRGIDEPLGWLVFVIALVPAAVVTVRRRVTGPASTLRLVAVKAPAGKEL